MAKAEQINCPTPLPENPTTPQLMEMLVPVPYQAPEKKTKKKKGKRPRAAPPQGSYRNSVRRDQSPLFL